MAGSTHFGVTKRMREHDRRQRAERKREAKQLRRLTKRLRAAGVEVPPPPEEGATR